MSKKNYKIYEHYKKEAIENGKSKISTMRDMGIRELELNILKNYISKIKDLKNNIEINVLELGCGNGYTVLKLAKKFKDIKFTSTDINEEMIKIAKRRNIPNVKFKITSATNIKFKDKIFDIVFTERCIMNLTSWKSQKESLKEIHRVLKTKGFVILLETFNSGWKMLNESRKTLGLEPINQCWHNVALNDIKFNKFIKGKFTVSNLLENNDTNFLSTYYYGTRILYPALIKDKKEIKYNNSFIQIFKYLPSFLNYSPIQLRLLEKK